MKKLIIFLSGVALLGGCSSILQSSEPTPTIYSLRAVGSQANVATDHSRKTATIIEVQRPSLPPGFDSARIAMYLGGGRRLDYYSGAKWASPLDEVLQDFTNQSVRKTFTHVIVAAPGQAIDSSYRLQTAINDFEPVYASGPDSPPVLTASITFTLLAMPEERIVTSFTVEKQAQSQDNTMSSIMAGLESLLQSVEGRAFETLAPYLR